MRRESMYSKWVGKMLHFKVNEGLVDSVVHTNKNWSVCLPALHEADMRGVAPVQEQAQCGHKEEL